MRARPDQCSIWIQYEGYANIAIDMRLGGGITEESRFAHLHQLATRVIIRHTQWP